MDYKKKLPNSVLCFLTLISHFCSSLSLFVFPSSLLSSSSLFSSLLFSSLLSSFFHVMSPPLLLSAISSWYCPSAEGRRGGAPRRPERDFVSLNREGLKSGLVTAKELQQYRGTHNISRPAPVRGVERRSMPTLVPPDMTFGICNRSESHTE